MKTAEQVVRKLIRDLKKEGWRACAVDDGEGNEPVFTERDAMGLIFGVEMSTLKFIKGGQIEAVSIIPCNGWEAICDFTCNTWEFQITVDGVIADLEEDL